MQLGHLRSPLTGHRQAEDTGVLRVELRVSGEALKHLNLDYWPKPWNPNARKPTVLMSKAGDSPT